MRLEILNFSAAWFLHVIAGCSEESRSCHQRLPLPTNHVSFHLPFQSRLIAAVSAHSLGWSSYTYLWVLWETFRCLQGFSSALLACMETCTWLLLLVFNRRGRIQLTSERPWSNFGTSSLIIVCRFRIKDPERSLDFYTRVLGLTLLEKLDFAESKFSLLFLGQYDKSQIPEDPSERVSTL